MKNNRKTELQKLLDLASYNNMNKPFSGSFFDSSSLLLAANENNQHCQDDFTEFPWKRRFHIPRAMYTRMPACMASGMKIWMNHWRDDETQSSRVNQKILTYPTS